MIRLSSRLIEIAGSGFLLHFRTILKVFDYSIAFTEKKRFELSQFRLTHFVLQSYMKNLKTTAKIINKCIERDRETICYITIVRQTLFRCYVVQIKKFLQNIFYRYLVYKISSQYMPSQAATQTYEGTSPLHLHTQNKLIYVRKLLHR